MIFALGVDIANLDMIVLIIDHLYRLLALSNTVLIGFLLRLSMQPLLLTSIAKSEPKSPLSVISDTRKAYLPSVDESHWYIIQI